VRVAAISALGDRDRQPEAMELIRRWSGAFGGGEDLDPQLRAVAQLAAIDLGIIRTAPIPASGLTVAQLFLHADIDLELTRSGVGDNGGVATLLLRLGAALAEDPQVSGY
jgi:hypothetical protein